MIKDIMTANESIAPNSREMEILKEHFPACFHSDGRACPRHVSCP